MDEGKLLGHIISKDGIRIDPARVEAIQHIDFLRNKKEIQGFNGKMNFLCIFIPNLDEHLREITNMLKKDNTVKWTEDAMKSFNLVKFALTTALVLISPDYTHDFIIFSFASKHTMATILMQKRDQVEKPIAFFSRTIRDVALHYNIIEKQALDLIKALKDFRVYILHSHTIAYVPNAAAKDVLMQTDPKRRRGKWIATMLEYDLEIKPTKLIKGQGLAKLMAESNLHALDINLIAAIWILIATDYFTKWIEAIPTRQATDMIIIQFLEYNILSRFGFPHKIITDNAVAFKSKKMVEFCNKYNITLVHSMAYYLQGNGLAKSSNKSLVNIIKKMLEANKKNWLRKLVNVLWADRVSSKKSIGMSPIELVYVTDTIFPTSLAVPIMTLLQEVGSKEDDIQRRINQTIHLWQTREEVSQNTFQLQEKIKKNYDRKPKQKSLSWKM
eukprot:PITA_03993